MKFWVKIIVALCVVGVIAFGIWAFFFKEKDEVMAYNRTCELVEYKEGFGVKEKLKELQKFNYLKDDEANVILSSNDTNKEILSLREIMLSNNIIRTYDDGGVVTCYFDSYIVMDKYLDEMINFLMPYIKNSNGNDNLNKAIKRTANTYRNNLNELSQAIDNLNACQKSIDGNEVEMTVLLGNYKSVRTKYRRCLNNGANLIINMFNIIKSNYGEIKFDTKLALIDSYARSLRVSSSEEKEKEEAFFAHDLHLILDRYIKVNKYQNIFTPEYDEYNFLINYNTLFNNYVSELDKALNKHNLGKTKMADGKDLSDIRQEAQNSLVFVLNVLGY